MKVIPMGPFSITILLRTNDLRLENLAREWLRIQKHVLVVSSCKIPLPAMLFYYILVLRKIVVVLPATVSSMNLGW